MRLITQERAEVKLSTKIFKGLSSMFEAIKYAEESKSYSFRVFSKERNQITKKTETVFYGYGVPR